MVTWTINKWALLVSGASSLTDRWYPPVIQLLIVTCDGLLGLAPTPSSFLYRDDDGPLFLDDEGEGTSNPGGDNIIT